MRPFVAAALAAVLFGSAAAAQSTVALAQAPVAAGDPFQWLEDITGARAVAWVQGQNAKTRAVLETDPRYETYRKEALAIFTAQDRIPEPRFRAGEVDNFWQDATHKRGLWRRTTLAGYRSADPQWETLLDIDALAKAEGKDWYWKGANCLEPEERLCLVRLSDGGKDAVTIREFDTKTQMWVPDGFVLPESKQNAAWLNRDTLLVSRDWGPGTTTKSGYAFVVKELNRGQSLDQASEVYRGKPDEISASAVMLRDADGEVKAVLYDRNTTFFEREYYLSGMSQSCGDETPAAPLSFPKKGGIQGLVAGQLVFKTEEDWKGFQAGDLLAYDFHDFCLAPFSAKPYLIARAKPNQSIEQVARTRDRLIVTGLEDVKGFVDVYDFANGHWTPHRLDLPKDQDVQIVDASRATNDFFLQTEGFLDPNALWLADAATGKVEKVKQLPPRFDASRDVVEQFWATSTDGTRIPYFVVHAKNIKLDGSTPTIMYGYGGFQLSKPPAYLPEVGKIWLERGGAYVIANIRGGGEFGPKWHEAVLREHRQLAFDDFASVARDLFKRGITSPRRLGIYGRSNGGVLMSVSMTQHPELWHAVVIESPLIDMLRYNHLSAGASWVGEYGDPDVPADRAFIAKYSAYQNLKPGMKYPKPYITTNAKDDRVHPSHARKFAAKLEAMGYPYLFFEDNFGGHSYDADPTANAARWARHYTYLSQQLMD
ncbi:MAG TPA: prolyl oligopeptidase family serine peptidase [Caulobacteraceae bacterium]|jgi:prolyl oligopeptidase|nr:prolyl oligopeptidase family serine peptidase [Caulobacteraceae bacterium]